VLFVADEKRPGKGFTSLYADVKGLGDLTKGERVTGKPVVRGSYYRDTTFAPFEVELPSGGDAGAYPVQARLAARFAQPGDPAPSSSSLYLTSLRAMEGMVELGGEKRTMLVFDANCNGVFGDTASVGDLGASSTGDRIWVGEEIGKIEETYVEALPVGKYYAFGGEYYELDFGDGRSVSIAETEVSLGRIQVTNPGFFLELAKDGDLFCISGKEQAADSPAGDYELVSASFRWENEGSIWELEGMPGSRAAELAVSHGGTAELAAGPPLAIVIDAKVKTRSDGTYVNMDFRLMGANGEEYRFLRRDGIKVPLPEISVRNETGREVKKGRFEYG